MISVGDSRDAVELLIQEAIEFHIEGIREEGIAASVYKCDTPKASN
ncbi:hypothetical protein [Nevskia soli]